MSLIAHKRKRHQSLLLAVALQAVLLCLSFFVMVREEAPPPSSSFEGEISMVEAGPQEARREERMRAFKRQMSRPRTFQALAVEQSLSPDLPPMPDLPVSGYSGEDFGFGGEGEALLAGLGIAADSIGGGTRRSQMEFFGVSDSGERIVIVVNTSASVVRKARNRGVSIDELHRRVGEVLDSLEMGTLFGLVQFSQGTRRFSDQLAPALLGNKKVAAEWIEENLRGNPPVAEEEAYLGHEAGLASAFELRPDLIFLVTDGVFNRRTRTGGKTSYPVIPLEQVIGTLERLEREFAVKPKLQVIGFELGEGERSDLKRLARRYSGTLTEF